MHLDENSSAKCSPPPHTPTKEDSPTDVTLLRLRMWWLMLGLCSWCLTELLRSLASMHSANELESPCSGGATPSLLYSRIARNLSKPHLWPSRRTVCYTPLLSINPPRRLVVLHLLSLRSGGLGTYFSFFKSNSIILTFHVYSFECGMEAVGDFLAVHWTRIYLCTTRLFW